MADQSKIQWTEATWNPWHGCVKVSPGCKYCYMFRDKERYGHDPTDVLRSKTKFKEPVKWKESKLIFTCSWSDWFIDKADAWRNDAWEVIRQCPQHTFQILTKRPERIQDNLPEFWDEIKDRVWIGVSVESNNQIHRISYLEKLDCVRFVSFEPLIGDVFDVHTTTCQSELMTYVDWAIIGGESGNESGKYLYRKCTLEWINHIILICKIYETPVFMKQLGTFLSKTMKLKDRHGGNIDEFPKQFQIRQFPKNYKP